MKAGVERGRAALDEEKPAQGSAHKHLGNQLTVAANPGKTFPTQANAVLFHPTKSKSRTKKPNLMSPENQNPPCSRFSELPLGGFIHVLRIGAVLAILARRVSDLMLKVDVIFSSTLGRQASVIHFLLGNHQILRRDDALQRQRGAGFENIGYKDMPCEIAAALPMVSGFTLKSKVEPHPAVMQEV